MPEPKGEAAETADVAKPPRNRQRSPAGNVGLASVAQIAGVSEATVSRVLNRKYGVAAATRASVEEALRQVGYERASNGELVLLLTPDLLNPIFGRMADRIENELNPYGLRSVICPVYPGTVQEQAYVESLIDTGIAAIVFLSSSNTTRNADPAVRQLIASRGVPYVCVNGGYPDSDAPVVSTDDWRAAEIAVNHLYGLGHRKIGMCAGPVGNTPADRRVEGFVQAMDRHDLPDSDDYVVRHYFQIDGGQRGALELLELGVTAIVASSDEMALGAIRALHRKGLRVPADVSVIGYDDSALLDFTDPPLTTVRQPTEQIAENVARLITSMIANRAVEKRELLLEPEIKLRGSTGLVNPTPR